MDDALATRSGPRSVGATLRALDSVSIALGVRSETSMAAQREREADRDRQQASLRKELRKSDAALSELRSEVCEHREKAQRVAAELWRLDGERARWRSWQRRCAAEVRAVCHSLQLDGDDEAVPPAELHDVAAAGGEPEELVELLTLALSLRGAAAKGVLLHADVLRDERLKLRDEWAAAAAERDELRAEKATHERTAAALSEARAERAA